MEERDETSIRMSKASLLAVGFVCLLAACGNSRPFDSAAWRQGDPRVRGRMVEDLVGSKMLVGRSGDEVQRSLGRPENEHPGALVYQINMGMPFKDPSRYAFILHLDADRKVRKAQIAD